jgi:hypothetical protein
MVKKNENPELNFNKLYIVLTKRFGLTTSAVYGVIDNYSKMSGKACKKSEPDIGDILGISWSLVEREIKNLISLGLIEEIPHDLNVSKMDKTKWYRPIPGKLLELNKFAASPLKSNDGRRTSQKRYKAEYLERQLSNSSEEIDKNYWGSSNPMNYLSETDDISCIYG